MKRTSAFVYLVAAALFTVQGIPSSVHGDDPFGGSPQSQSNADKDDPFGGAPASKSSTDDNDPFAAPAAPSKKSKGLPLPAFSEAREAAALVFVKQNCPELLKTLDEYRKVNVAGYHQAIRQFFQWSEISTDGSFQDEEGMKLALQGSKAQFESQLLSAKLMSEPSQIDGLKGQLRELIENSVDLEIAQAKHQIAKVEMQLAAMRARSDSLVSKRDQTIANRLSSLEKMVAERISLSNIPEDLKTAIQQVQEAARLKAAKGHDVSHVAQGMRHIEMMIRKGEKAKALEILKKALEYLNR